MLRFKIMKILILNWRDINHHNKGGAELVIFEYARSWVRAGHQVTWFSSSSPGRPKEEVIAGIRIIRHGGELGTVHLAAFFWYFRHGRGQFDLVVDQFHGMSSYGFLRSHGYQIRIFRHQLSYTRH